MKDLIINILVRNGFEQDLIREILEMGRSVNIAAGQLVVSPGVKPTEVPLVINGILKVLREDAQGNEAFLYYLNGGETCAMSITCCLGIRKSEFKLEAEEDSLLWMIPIYQMDDWVKRYNSFRKFIFGAYQDRFEELLATIDSMAFMQLDERLFKYLLDTKQSTGSYIIRKTHGQIANDLNTSRVVVSRLLKKLEKEGKIELYRNRVEVL